jgi:hypothetical protein
MSEHYDDELSPRYKQMLEELKTILGNSKKPLTIRQLKEKLDNTDFLWDALDSLEASGYILNVGGIMLPKFVIAKEPPKDTLVLRTCRKCGEEKPPSHYEREWSGHPAPRCKACREGALARRGQLIADFGKKYREGKGKGLLPTKKP